MIDIPTYIEEWRAKAPWNYDYQIQQDLIISRALIDLYSDSFIKDNLAFRGGTALNKLFLKTPARYSEDIDLVQIHNQPIGSTIDSIRKALYWLGKPNHDYTKRSVRLVYKYPAIGEVPKKLKIEINITERFTVNGFKQYHFSMEDNWFSSNALITSYDINELIGTKLRALHQRSKGRDLFDLYWVIKNELINCKDVVNIFINYCENKNDKVTRALFEETFQSKLENKEFLDDILSLLPRKNASWAPDQAVQIIKERIVELLPGNPLKKI